MSSSALIPLAMFLLNEATRELYVLPPEAAVRVEGSKPCAPIKANITATEFSASTLDQMCAFLSQSLLPKISPLTKAFWSSEHANRIGTMIRQWGVMGGVRSEAQVWPPDVPFGILGLNQPRGISVVFGVRAVEKQAALLERVDVWSQVDGRFLRSYWSRSIYDPTNLQPATRAIHRVGTGFQRAWKSPSAPEARQELLRLLVDKRISERELASLESVIKGFSKSAPDIQLVPIDVRKDGILYQTQIPRGKVQDVISKLSKDLPVLRAQATAEGPVDISLVLAAPR